VTAKQTGIACAGVILLAGAILLWQRSPRWSQENRDAFVRACALSGGISASAVTSVSGERILETCECLLRELERQLSFDDMKREEALMMARGFRPTKTMSSAMLACVPAPRVYNR
jgi:hypothetical protein